jgi:hypothetical protein
MAAGQKKRWAAVRKAKAGPAATPASAKAGKKKRRLSPEGGAHIVAATAVAPRKAAGRAKAARKRPAAERGQGGQAAAPAMAEGLAISAPGATAE